MSASSSETFPLVADELRSSTPSKQPMPISPSKLDEAGKLNALKTQLEFYFSKQNLAQDMYLLSHMDLRKYVPVAVIASFPRIKSLTEENDVLIKVMKECKNLTLDETNTMVKPNLKTERNTLILRDITKDVPEEEVRAIFAYKGCGNIQSVKPDVADTWFVTFDTENECLEAVNEIRSKQFRGQTIRCGVKSESAIRSVNPALAQAVKGSMFAGAVGGAQGTSPQGQQGPGGKGGFRGNVNGGYLNNGQAYYGQYNNYGYNPSWQSNYKGSAMNTPYQNIGGYMDANAVPAVSAGIGQGGAPQGGKGKNVNRQRTDRNDAGGRNQGGVLAGRGPTGQMQIDDTRKGGRKGQQNFNAASSTSIPSPDLNAFPALPGFQAKKKGGGGGYSGPFLQYSREEMAAIVDMLTARPVERPESMPESNAAFREKPLLQVQLLQPIPIMYPASPSPTMIMEGSSAAVPFLDLSGNPIPSLDSQQPSRRNSTAVRDRSNSASGNSGWKAPGVPASPSQGPAVAPGQAAGQAASVAQKSSSNHNNKQAQNNKQSQSGRPQSAKMGKSDESSPAPSSTSSSAASLSSLSSLSSSSSQSVGAEAPKPFSAAAKYAQLAAQKPSAEALAQAQAQAQLLALRKAKELAAQQKNKKENQVEKEKEGSGKDQKGDKGDRKGGKTKGEGNRGSDRKQTEGKGANKDGGPNGNGKGNRKAGGRGRPGTADEAGRGEQQEEQGDRPLTWAERAKQAAAAAAAAAAGSKSAAAPEVK